MDKGEKKYFRNITCVKVIFWKDDVFFLFCFIYVLILVTAMLALASKSTVLGIRNH